VPWRSGDSHGLQAGITAEAIASLCWIMPTVVVEVSFVELTRDDLLRHSQFVALRQDKRARDLTREAGRGSGLSLD
jgi:ATP-dependent DNA ligase